MTLHGVTFSSNFNLKTMLYRRLQKYNYNESALDLCRIEALLPNSAENGH